MTPASKWSGRLLPFRPLYVLAAAAAMTVVFIGVSVLLFPNLLNRRSHQTGEPGAGVALVWDSAPASADAAAEAPSDADLSKLRALGYLGGGGDMPESIEEEEEAAREPSPVVRSPAPRPPPPPPTFSRPSKSSADAPASASIDDFRQKNESGRRDELRRRESQVLEEKVAELGDDKLDFEDSISKRDPWAKAGRKSGTVTDGISVGGAMTEEADDDSAVGGFWSMDDMTAVPRHNASRGQAAESRAAFDDFWQHRLQIEGLAFQEATGYWANTYLPGDPAIRHLAMRLLERDTTPLEALATEPLRLHSAARQTSLPLDAPGHAALAVYLNADHPTVSEPTRMLVQVGLQGTPRFGGRRPAMNVGVVLDLRHDLSPASWASARALCAALIEARDMGDSFRLVVAGRPRPGRPRPDVGLDVLGPDDFRHGPMTVAFERLAAETPVTGSPVLSITHAFQSALMAVAATDDPTRPLGSSVVLLVTPGSLGNDVETLVAMAHQSAVAGVPVSAVGLGPQAVVAELDRIALAGQGSRRLLAAPAEASALVDRELMAVARVVARAVRLRVRLAPGVELVEVLGSRRLDAAQSQRVRRAEKAIDQRLSRNLGIVADRGDDEEGIQIVIPSYYAGDTHVVLLDVVVPGPGPVADVTVRYKDLVQMGNAVARDHLHLHHGKSSRGPIERSVVKSFLAYRLEQNLREAGTSLTRGDIAAVERTLSSWRVLLTGFQQFEPGYDKDRGLARNIAMIDEYLALVSAGAGDADPSRSHLADSLRYAAHLVVLPRPDIEGGGP